MIEDSLADPATRQQGIALAAATHDSRYRAKLERFALDGQAPEDVRVAAIEALGSYAVAPDRALDELVASVRTRPSSSAIAEAAVRAMAQHSGREDRMIGLVTARDYPLGLRRAALHALARYRDGAERVLDLARTGKLPDDLKNEATTIVHTSRKRSLRDQARTILPLPKMASGRTLPSFFELIRRQGDAHRGEAVFFRAGSNSCSSCHRVQGRGQWVGPDLSTIGVKYGRDELIRSILSPSVGDRRELSLAGRGSRRRPCDHRLAGRRDASRLVLKTAEGQRITIDPKTIDDRRTSDVSLMPDGLAQTLTDKELVDLLEYLTTLKQPVSIVGQYQAVGPVSEPSGPSSGLARAMLEARGPVDDGRGGKLAWRRQTSDAEGLADLSPLLAGDSKNAAYAWVPVSSPAQQPATLVCDVAGEVAAWLDGKPLALTRGKEPGAPPASAHRAAGRQEHTVTSAGGRRRRRRSRRAGHDRGFRAPGQLHRRRGNALEGRKLIVRCELTGQLPTPRRSS